VVTRCGTSESGSWELDSDGASGQRQLRAAAVIDASGRAARIARSLGGSRVVRDRLVGVATYYERGPEPGAYMQIEAAADGWWYSAPLPAGRMVVMLMTDADICGRRRFADAAGWDQRLGEAQQTRERIEGWRRIGAPRVFSAVSHRLRRPPAARWLATGDAAIAVDPLSSSGLTRALLTGYAAAHAMTHALAGGGAPIAAYETRLDEDFDGYWRDRAGFYGLERRWPAAPFWQRRRD